MYWTVLLCVLCGCETWCRSSGAFDSRLVRSESAIIGSMIRKLHSLYTSWSVTLVIGSRRMRWAEHVARTREKRNAYRILVGNLKGRARVSNPRGRCVGCDKWQVDGKVWSGFSWLRMGTSGGWCGVDNEILNLVVLSSAVNLLLAEWLLACEDARRERLEAMWWRHTICSSLHLILHSLFHT